MNRVALLLCRSPPPPAAPCGLARALMAAAQGRLAPPHPSRIFPCPRRPPHGLGAGQREPTANDAPYGLPRCMPSTDPTSSRPGPPRTVLPSTVTVTPEWGTVPHSGIPPAPSAAPGSAPPTVAASDPLTPLHPISSFRPGAPRPLPPPQAAGASLAPPPTFTPPPPPPPPPPPLPPLHNPTPTLTHSA